jgi:hypothetical protein
MAAINNHFIRQESIIDPTLFMIASITISLVSIILSSKYMSIDVIMFFGIYTKV